MTEKPNLNHEPLRRASRNSRRRGMAVLLVLGLLAITLAVSYAALRTQGTTSNTARNAGRSLDARLAAESGLAAAMHKISDSSWQGVDVNLTGDVTDDSWYEVTFTTGDAALLPADLNYAEFPYRLTITSTGYAEDPANPDVRAIHKVRSVVQLARKSLVANPGNWSTLTGYTIYQWANRTTQVQEPIRVSGPAFILGTLYLSTEYPSPSPARTRYLQDLNAMRLAGRGDHRPFNGPLSIAYTRNSGSLTALQTWLGLTTIDNSLASTSAPLTHPGDVASYRLYPGGKAYTPPVLQDSYGGTLQNVSLGPDPQTNPLGLFRCRGALAIQNNVNIKGIVVADSTTPDIQIYGTNVVLQAASLPKLEGSNQNYQLPILIVREDVRIHGGSGTQIKGVSVLFDEFELKRGAPTTTFALTGNLLAAGVNLKGRDTWTMTVADWTNDYNNFNGSGIAGPVLALLLDAVRALFGLPAGATVHFPEYMQHVRGFTVQPALTLQPDLSGVLSHWQDWTQPIYQKDPGDPGLRWNLVRYEDGV